MILVAVEAGELRMTGHAEDVRVCAAVSAVTCTLYNGYAADRPTPGQFRLDLAQIHDTGVVDFVLNMFRLLARQYPEELQLQE